MEDSKGVTEKARVYTTHGKKKNQGMLAVINSKMALAYTEKQGEKMKIVGYTPVEEILKRGYSGELPHFQLDY